MMLSEVHMWQVYTPCAPANSGDGRYRRPVNLWVVWWDKSTRITNIRQVERSIHIGSNLDSRYTGPRSKYGKYLSYAKDLVRELNYKEIA